jgi:hypothetical protein
MGRISYIPDSEDEEEKTSQSDSEVKKVLSYDESATQAYAWNDSDTTGELILITCTYLSFE